MIEISSTPTRVYAPHRLRIQRRRTAGYRLPEKAVYVGRPTMFGNPFRRDDAIEAGYLNESDDCQTQHKFLVECFLDWLIGSPFGPTWWDSDEAHARRAAILRALPMLREKPLACWCSLDLPCHADVLATLANQY